MSDSRAFGHRMREAGCSRAQRDALMSNLKRAKSQEARWSVMLQIEKAIAVAQAKKARQLAATETAG